MTSYGFNKRIVEIVCFHHKSLVASYKDAAMAYNHYENNIKDPKVNDSVTVDGKWIGNLRGHQVLTNGIKFILLLINHTLTLLNSRDCISRNMMNFSPFYFALLPHYSF